LGNLEVSVIGAESRKSIQYTSLWNCVVRWYKRCGLIWSSLD